MLLPLISVPDSIAQAAGESLDTIPTSIDSLAQAAKSSFDSIPVVHAAEKLFAMPVDQIVSSLSLQVITVAGRMALALAIYYAGRWLIRKVRRVVKRIMLRRHVEPSLASFLGSFVNIVLTIILIGTIIGTLGFSTASFVALFASATVAIGLALSGTMQNFAGGIMLLIFKPFKVGDNIEAQGQAGTVKSLQLINTVIITPDNRTVMLPNGAVFSGVINNTSCEDLRRVEWIFGIAYGNDYDKAKMIISGLLEADKRVLPEPPYFIAMHSLGNSSVNIVVRAWVNSGDFWNVYFDLNEKVYKAFPSEGISLPFPQMDVHVYDGQ